MGKKGDLSIFERGMVNGARRTGLSISQSAQLLGFSRTTISRRRMGRVIQADRRSTLTQITTRFNRGMQSICEATTCTTLRRMDYTSRRPHRVPLISTKNSKMRLQFQLSKIGELKTGKMLPEAIFPVSSPH
uniref:Transposase Tc1-like domain-containing protein n=1 Tax=Sander lucioperca TaxID=283035 RepID=A0A8C9X626_SANLU